MRTDNAPVSQTCPKIDDVLATVKEIYMTSSEISKGELQSIEKTMEQIRSANLELRNWGNDQYDRAEELEKEMEYYKDLAESRESEIKELEKEIKELSSQS